MIMIIKRIETIYRILVIIIPNNNDPAIIMVVCYLTIRIEINMIIKKKDQNHDNHNPTLTHHNTPMISHIPEDLLTDDRDQLGTARLRRVGWRTLLPAVLGRSVSTHEFLPWENYGKFTGRYWRE